MSDHVMISYNWGHQKEAKVIKDALQERGYKIWIDEINMKGDINKAMAEGVDNACVVLLCVTEAYKDSYSCNKEASYADQRRKNIIALKLEKDVELDGWIGPIIGGKLWFDFSNFTYLKETITALDKELKSLGVKKYGHAMKNNLDQPLKTLNVDGVCNWLKCLEIDDDTTLKFRENCVNGEDMTELTLEDLTDEDFKIAQFKAKRILKKRDKMLKDASTKSGDKHTVSEGVKMSDKDHVMISYNWSHKKEAKVIGDALQERGYKIWVDEINMKGDINKAMAEGVDNACAVLLCVTEAYKDSYSCNKEASYADQRRKNIIALKLEKDVEFDGWIGPIIGGQLWFDFSNFTHLKKSIKALDKELTSLGVKKEIDLDQPLKTLNVDGVCNWLKYLEIDDDTTLKFRENCVNGEDMTKLTLEDLTDEDFKIAQFKAKKILKKRDKMLKDASTKSGDKHTVSEGITCSYYRDCLEVRKVVNIPDTLTDFQSKFNKCYCNKCHTNRGESYSFRDGSGPHNLYTKPIGWGRVMLKLPPQAVTLDIFKEWNAAFHGTSPDSIHQIVLHGELLFPGDTTMDGVKLREVEGHFNDAWKPAGFDTKQIFLSPSIKYSGSEVYAKRKRIRLPGSGRAVFIRTVLQVRVKPDQIKVGPQTISRSDDPIDPPIGNDVIEWSLTARKCVILTAVLIQVQDCEGKLDT